MNSIDIDIETRSYKYLIARLNKISWAVDVSENGQYMVDSNWSNVVVITDKTEKFVDNWLYRTKDKRLGNYGVYTVDN